MRGRHKLSHAHLFFTIINTMSIKDFSKKVKHFFSSDEAHDLYIVLIIILVAFSSFGLGRLSKVEEGGESITIEYPLELQRAGAYSATSSTQNASGAYLEDQMSKSTTTGENSFVASKNGSKYHYPWCSGAKQMKEENKIWFATREEAEAAGYTKALNCKGL